MISRILRHFSQVALDFAMLNVRNIFPQYRHDGRTRPAVYFFHVVL